MTITSEMLAAYAEGKVFGAERDAIRKYLADNPSELHTVAMVMDEDYDLDMEDEDCNVDAEVSNLPPFSNLCYSAALFVPIKMAVAKEIVDDSSQTKDSFEKRLNDLMNDLETTID